MSVVSSWDLGSDCTCCVLKTRYTFCYAAASVELHVLGDAEVGKH
jgi:hypothetical protein